ncbi:MAG: tRNA (guanine(10)-N(2))-dimethyltransferase [Candidatus Heimdallarchaeota archaeon]|nr:tRNA (guanine(10)-N(2))-dimethyltransferase [Candidatus Heimdallarchaeota archaeon]MBY8994001.1 tRNA (guanine(10)-N(2))-dimethyltransferase [Candidatus Heimdallarchaeota archaeon]
MVDYPLETVVEGKTKILVPDVEAFRKSPSSYPPSDAPVFYNKVMELNRDFALATLRVYIDLLSKKESLFYCEPMAGSGIRAVRIANELENISVVINDRNPHAVELIKENVKQLKLTEKTSVHMDDACELMIRHAASGNRFDVIDVDPFGSPSVFMDSAAQALGYNGFLAVTSTDMATMCGVYPKACIRKYASKPIHSSIGHEVAVRMLIGFIATNLARHGKGTKPIFAHSTEHYIRAYVVAEKGITKAKESMNTLGYIAHCLKCYAIESRKGLINSLTKECPDCQNKHRLLGGPVWLGDLYDEQFVNKLKSEVEDNKTNYGSQKKMGKMLVLIEEEVKAQQTNAGICFFDLHQISDKLNIPSPKVEAVMEELAKGGYSATRTHFRTNSIKTDAPIDKIVSAMKKVLNI